MLDPQGRVHRALCQILAAIIIGPIVAGAALIGSLLIRDLRAATLTIPYTFAPNTPAYSAQVNANFSAIRDVVNSLDNANIANSSITGAIKLTNLSVSLAKMGTNSVDSSKIVDGSIATADVDVAGLGAAAIATGAITVPKIDVVAPPGSVNNNSILRLNPNSSRLEWLRAETTGYVTGTVGTLYVVDAYFASIRTGVLQYDLTLVDDYLGPPPQASGKPIRVYNFSAIVNQAPGQGKSWSILLNVAGSGTGCGCTINDAATTCSTFANPFCAVDISGHKKLAISVTPSGTPAAVSELMYSFAYTGIAD